MATDAETLLVSAYGLGYPSLSTRDLKIATLYILASGLSNLTASQAISGGMAQGYDALSERSLDECILAVLSS